MVNSLHQSNSTEDMELIIHSLIATIDKRRGEYLLVIGLWVACIIGLQEALAVYKPKENCPKRYIENNKDHALGFFIPIQDGYF